ncbi:MAG TPA: BatA domain-containing protein [candidate division Zixibacteria bacterium]|nr:BatA domain-containing protein [candidate division Zixibacteria bacterium]
MSIFFLYPVYLFGLLAAAVPLLIHLLNRRRLKRLRFPAVRFVALSQRRVARSYRLRHWLLLALRTAAVALLALLLANPVFQIGAGLFAGGGPLSLVVVVDNSLSMKWSGGGAGFRRAKDAARTLLSALGEGDRAAVFSTAVSADAPLRLKSERDALLRDLEAIELSDGSADLAAALGKAYELLAEPAGHKEIRLITDLALTGWDDFTIAALKQYDPAVPITILRVGGSRPPVNAAVREVRAGGERGIGAGVPLRLEAVLANFGDGAVKDLLVQLSIDGKAREQRLASLAPKSESTVVFQTALERAGSHYGTLTLKAEGLAGQTEHHFGLLAEDRLRVLLVDGEPQTSLVQSETFFLSRALHPGGDAGASLFVPVVTIADALAGTSLENYQVVVLANVATLPEAFAARLREFVRRGGGLLIFGGEHLSADDYNARLLRVPPALLPGSIAGKKSGPETAADGIARVEATHPALAPLADPVLLDSIRSTRVWGYTRLERGGGTALISLASGEPLLTEHRVGRGRVMFLGTSADRDWSDLPLKTAYLPLVQSLASYLAGGRRGSVDTGIAVGEEKRIDLPPSMVGRTIRVVGPGDREGTAEIVANRDRAVASYRGNERAGIYRIVLPADREKPPGLPELYAVNSPFLESRLDPIGEAELRAKLAPVRAEVIPVESVEEGGARTDLAFPLLISLIATLLLEGWIAQRL